MPGSGIKPEVAISKNHPLKSPPKVILSFRMISIFTIEFNVGKREKAIKRYCNRAITLSGIWSNIWRMDACLGSQRCEVRVVSGVAGRHSFWRLSHSRNSAPGAHRIITNLHFSCNPIEEKICHWLIILQGVILMGWLTAELLFNPAFLVPAMHYPSYAVAALLILNGWALFRLNRKLSP